jgi:hypothetical protein
MPYVLASGLRSPVATSVVEHGPLSEDQLGQHRMSNPIAVLIAIAWAFLLGMYTGIALERRWWRVRIRRLENEYQLCRMAIMAIAEDSERIH